MLFLKAEKKSFKKGNDTLEYVNSTFLDENNIPWDMSVKRELQEEIFEIEPRTECTITIEMYKTKFEGKENIKLRLQGIE